MREFTDVHVIEMRRFSNRRMVLLIDFDEDSQRLSDVRNGIPEDLSDRVFVLGVLSEPERLRTDVEMSFEEIGKALADDCVNDKRSTWAHDLLSHNEAELDHMDRTDPSIREILFR